MQHETRPLIGFDGEERLREFGCYIPDCPPNERHTRITRDLMQGGKSEKSLVAGAWRRWAGRKLDLRQAKEIRQRYRRERITMASLAQEFGINRKGIWMIIHGHSYRDTEAAS